MTILKSQIRINAPKEQVWAELANLGDIQNYHPGVKISHYTSETKKGIGASRHCDFGANRTIEESAIDWKEGEEYTLKLHSGKKMPPFKSAFGRQTVKWQLLTVNVLNETIERIYSARPVLVDRLSDQYYRLHYSDEWNDL